MCSQPYPLTPTLSLLQPGSPFRFPQFAKGAICNTATVQFGLVSSVCIPGFGATPTITPLDPAPPSFMIPSQIQSPMADTFYSEFVWDVGMLDLGPGTYPMQLVLYDGDCDIVIRCLQITLVP